MKFGNFDIDCDIVATQKYRDYYNVLFKLEELEEFNNDYCVEEFLPNHCLIGSSGGGELFGIDTVDNFFAVPAIPMDEEDKIIAGNSFLEFLKNLDTYLE